MDEFREQGGSGSSLEVISKPLSTPRRKDAKVKNVENLNKKTCFTLRLCDFALKMFAFLGFETGSNSWILGA